MDSCFLVLLGSNTELYSCQTSILPLSVISGTSALTVCRDVYMGMWVHIYRSEDSLGLGQRSDRVSVLCSKLVVSQASGSSVCGFLSPLKSTGIIDVSTFPLLCGFQGFKLRFSHVRWRLALHTHTFNPNTYETRGRQISTCSRSALFTELGLLQREALSRGGGELAFKP